MKIGIDIRTLMDRRYSGVSEYTLNLINEILKLDSSTGSEQVNDYRLFYNCFGDCLNIPKFTSEKVKMVKYNYPNKILNYLFFKLFNYPKIDKELGVDLFFMPHINFIGLSKRLPRQNNLKTVISTTAIEPREKSLKDENGQYKGFLPAVEMTSRREIKSIITVHDLSFLKYPEFFSWRKNFWHRMIKVKKLIKRFDCIVAVSENTKRDIIELCGVDENKIKVIYAGVNNEFGKNINQIESLEVKNKYQLPNKFILYLGTIEPRKNVDGIIRAYNQLRAMSPELRDYKLVLAGEKGWKSDKIYKEWENSEFKDDIKFLGYVDSKDKVYIYSLAGVFVYPSFYEGFGFPPLEAMACGVPTITSYAASLPEVTGEAAILVNPYNINNIAQAMMEILIDENLKKRLIERGLERVKKFSWDQTAREYLEIFNKL